MNIIHIPVEVFYNVLEYCDPAEIYLHFRNVCMQFREYVEYFDIVKSLDSSAKVSKFYEWFDKKKHNKCVKSMLYPKFRIFNKSINMSPETWRLY